MISVELVPDSRIYNLPYPQEKAIEDAYRRDGIDCIKTFNGMFAFSLVDDENDRHFLVRDRYGIKSIFYRIDDEKISWSERIKPLLRLGKEVDLHAVNQYFTFQNIFDDGTFFKGIKLLPAGYYLDGHELHQYWDYDFDSSLAGEDEKVVAEEVRRLLEQAVERQSVKGMGCFLSGGMDTSSITAMAVKRMGRLATFTCGFDISSATGLELGFDETVHAEYMANLLKTEQYEVILHAGDMEAVLPKLIEVLEEPRMGQCYPDFYTMRLASKFVGVALSGSGGDELFGGYPWRYFHGAGAKTWDDYERKYYEYWQRIVRDDEKIELFRPEVMSQIGDISSYDVFTEVVRKPEANPETLDDFLNLSMRLEIKTFLHGLFVIGNKIGWDINLEVRYPFMDNDLVDYAMRIPPSMKIENLGQVIEVDEDDVGRRRLAEGGKKILKQAMKGIIPDRILERGKQGFSAPDGAWFRGESVDYVKSVLLNPEARIYEYLQSNYVSKRLDDHFSGKINNRLFIWSCLCFEWWLRKNFTRDK